MNYEMKIVSISFCKFTDARNTSSCMDRIRANANDDIYFLRNWKRHNFIVYFPSAYKETRVVKLSETRNSAKVPCIFT